MTTSPIHVFFQRRVVCHLTFLLFLVPLIPINLFTGIVILCVCVSVCFNKTYNAPQPAPPTAESDSQHRRTLLSVEGLRAFFIDRSCNTNTHTHLWSLMIHTQKTSDLREAHTDTPLWGSVSYRLWWCRWSWHSRHSCSCLCTALHCHWLLQRCCRILVCLQSPHAAAPPVKER